MQIKQDQVKGNSVVKRCRTKQNDYRNGGSGDSRGRKSSQERDKKKNNFNVPYMGSDVPPEAVSPPEVKAVSTYQKCDQTGTRGLLFWTRNSKQEVKHKTDKLINCGSRVILEPLDHKDRTSTSFENINRMMEAVHCLEPALSKPMMLPPLQSPLGGASGVDCKKSLRRRRSQSFDTAMLHTLQDGQKHMEALNNSKNSSCKLPVNERLRNGIATPRVGQKIRVIKRPAVQIGGGILQQLYNHIDGEHNTSRLATKDRVEKHLNITVANVTKGCVNDQNFGNQGQGQLQGRDRIPRVNRCITRSRSTRPDSRMSMATSSLVVPSTTVSQVSF